MASSLPHFLVCKALFTITISSMRRKGVIPPPFASSQAHTEQGSGRRMGNMLH